MTAQDALPIEDGAPKRRAPAKVKRTEKEMLDLLRLRHVREGNGGGGEFAFLSHVRNGAGFNADRTFDAIVMNLWPSRGLELLGFEVKCSRSDWLRELKEPAKAEACARVVDRFSVVAADSQIVALGELPSTWGLLVARGDKLECVKEAPLLPGADPKRPISRGQLVAFLRAAGAVPKAEAEELKAARAEGFEQGMASNAMAVEVANAGRLELARTIQAFETASGVRFESWAGNLDPAEVGKMLRSILEGDGRAEKSRQCIKEAQDNLRRAADELGRYLS